MESMAALRERVNRLFTESRRRSRVHKPGPQLSLDIGGCEDASLYCWNLTDDIGEFVDHISSSVPDGDAYLFGGLLRDIALFGRRGFSSDIDIVVDGSWETVSRFLDTCGANKNKFGGYRLRVGRWPVDVWNARETWAIREGYVRWAGIASLTETTVLNWDAILMNWRTGSFISRPKYFEELRERILDIVLEENPNSKGMAVRVFRHLCLKDARRITARAARYLADCTGHYSFDDIVQAEKESYGDSVVDPAIYRFFQQLRSMDEGVIRDYWDIAISSIKGELGLV